MRNIFTILFSTVFVFSSIGCDSTSNNSNNQNTNVSTPTATPTIATNNNSNLSNANVANANVKQDEPVPTFTDANTALTEGNKYFDADKTEKAIEAFKQAVKLNPDLAEAHFQLGVAFALLESEEEKEVKVAEPEPSKTPKKGAKEVVKKKESEKSFENAIKAYQKILAKNPKDDKAQFNLARSYNKLNKDKEAEKAIRQAVKLKPDDTEYQTELGAILIKFAKYDEAIGVFKKALKLDESNSQAQDLMEKAQAGKKRQEYGIPKDKLKDSGISKQKPKAEKSESSVSKETSKKEQ